MLKIFLNNKRIPFTPPLFHENRFLTDFKEKTELFNSFFSNHFFLSNKCSTRPTNPKYVTDERLRTINFTADNIEKIIVSLNSNKAHGHLHISMRMLKIFGDTICKSPELIFKQALTTGVFPSEWKKGNIVHCYKKCDKRNLKLKPKFLPPSFSTSYLRINFERFMFNEMLSFFLGNNRLAPNESGFRPGDSCISQLLSITYDRSGILDDMVNILSHFLRNRKQRVTLNGQSSPWTSVNVGVPQRSILGPLLFLIYIIIKC